MSDANRVQLAIVEEKTLGEIPNKPSFAILRYTGSPDLGFIPATIASNEISADRNVTDLLLVGAEAGGAIEAELSYGAFDTIFEGALFNPWVVAKEKIIQGVVGDICVNTKKELVSQQLDFTEFGLTAGQWVKIGGNKTSDHFDKKENNVWLRINKVDKNILAFDVLPTGFGEDPGTNKTILVFLGDYLRNGTLKKSYTVERQFQDHDPKTYEFFKGMGINTLAINMEAQDVVKVNIGLQGVNADIENNGQDGADYKPAPHYPVFNTSSNVGIIRESGQEITGPNYVLEASIEIDNNLRQQHAVGALGAIGMGAGEFIVKGKLTTYFGNKELIKKLLDNSETSFEIRFQRGNHVLIFDLPRVKLASGHPIISGKNTDVTAEITYQALKHSKLGYTMQIQRFDIEE